VNATIEKFGYPATLVAEYRHWVVLLRPAQPTLGSLVLAAKSDAQAFPDLPQAAFAELWDVTADIEAVLQRAIGFERINYMMLMMVDPHVHFHVIPRYEGTRRFEGIEVGDAGWPGVAALSEALKLAENDKQALVAWLKSAWPTAV
jgi:diadenosine tetraphosphate (Ap4A) HIT family hydrolase